VIIVPFLYLTYRDTPTSISAQTVVAHATSLGVAFVASTVGTWRYAREHAISWSHAATYAVPGILSAFVTARALTRVGEVSWIRAVFGTFLLISAFDMARRARGAHRNEEPRAPHSPVWLALTGILGGALASLLGIGGGLIAVPVLLYVGQLPIRAVAPTALAGVCLTTLAGGLGYLTAGTAPPVSSLMAGFVDIRMAVPLALGAACTVPLGVRLNRAASPPSLFWFFAAIFGIVGFMILKEGVGG
jgi:hypothetical protein